MCCDIHGLHLRVTHALTETVYMLPMSMGHSPSEKGPRSRSKLHQFALVATLAALTAATITTPATANTRPVAAHTVVVDTTPERVTPGAIPDTIGKLHTITTIGSSQDRINLDQNPYGLAIAPATSGKITQGDLVICNFNDGIGGLNIQSLGSTVEVLHPVVGATPKRLSIDPRITGCGALTFDKAGELLVTSYTSNDIGVLNYSGTVINTITDASLAGPWGGIFGARPGNIGSLYVSNAYSGNIVRIHAGSPTRFHTLITGIVPNHGVPGAILAPAGLTYDPATDRLFIVDGNANRVLVLSNASTLPGGGIFVSANGSFTGPLASNLKVFYSGAPLNGPLSSVMLFNGHLVVGNTGDNNLIDFNPNGTVSAKKLVDTGMAGAIFGLVASGNSINTLKIYFNDDNDNTLKVLSP
ncbi:MAG: hypothetical protein NVSMB64_00800 [Candidatus Velthaea sp.]